MVSLKTILPQVLVPRASGFLDIQGCSAVEVYNTENSLFLACLGMSFWAALKADLISYSDKGSYDINADYLKDDIVVYCDAAFIALEDNTGQLPTSKCWQEAPRFTTTAYEELYVLYLRRYIALSVLFDNLVMYYVQIKSSGLLMTNTDTAKSASETQFRLVHKALNNLISQVLTNMTSYLKLNSNAFGLTKIVATECCCECGLATCGGCDIDDYYEYEVA